MLCASGRQTVGRISGRWSSRFGTVLRRFLGVEVPRCNTTLQIQFGSETAFCRLGVFGKTYCGRPRAPCIPAVAVRHFSRGCAFQQHSRWKMLNLEKKEKKRKKREKKREKKRKNNSRKGPIESCFWCHRIRLVRSVVF